MLCRYEVGKLVNDVVEILFFFFFQAAGGIRDYDVTGVQTCALPILGQGFAGGPLLPLTQTLLLRIFPKEMHSKAMAGWAMTVVVAPIVGPLLGGYISDNWSWPWIFFINLPIIAIIFLATLALLRGKPSPTRAKTNHAGPTTRRSPETEHLPQPVPPIFPRR